MNPKFMTGRIRRLHTSMWSSYPEYELSKPGNTASWDDRGYCSRCHCRTEIDIDSGETLSLENIKEWKYCPFCGARMSEED